MQYLRDTACQGGGLKEQGGDVSHDIISRLLYPVSPNEFLERFWGRRYLSVNGWEDRLSGLFSLDRFWQLLESAPKEADSPATLPRKGLLVRAWFGRGSRQLIIRPAEARRFYNEGASICVEGMATVDDQLASIAFGLKQALNLVGFVDPRVYLSPDGEGLAEHFDARIATTLQVEGSKRWRFSTEPSVAWPRYQVSITSEGGCKPDRALRAWEQFKPFSECECKELVLRPGDVLCLPAGSWHTAEAIGYSLAINFALDTPGGFLQTLTPMLDHVLAPKAEWRQCPPPFIKSDEVSPIPLHIEQFFRDRLDELINLLTSIRENPEEQRRLWLEFIKFYGRAQTTISRSRTTPSSRESGI